MSGHATGHRGRARRQALAAGRLPGEWTIARREFLQACGLFVGIVGARLGAQESGRGASRAPREAPDLAAWLHIDERGRVTAYTGKVEIGQNIRTSLAQAIGDELRVPVESVTLVMGDTDRTPFDAGTFGSLTTPRMAPQMARAAVTAREMLIDRAAAEWKVDRATLTARDGRIVGAGGRSASYGELTRGQKLTGTVAADAPIAGPDAWSLRGREIRKVNGRAIVTGQQQFTPDLVRPGMLHGRVVRPVAYGATLASVDDTAAARLPGVRVVRDGDFVGVLAPNTRVAARAVAAVRAEWRQTSGQPSSETVYEFLKKNAVAAGGGRGASPYVAGDIAQARASAARTFETSFHIPYIAHVPLEPRAAVAEWTDGKLTVWTATQRPFGVRGELAEAFGLAEDRVRVIVPDMGSAYGGKHSGEHAVEAARLAKLAGKPVTLLWTRQEEFAWGYFRPAGVIDVKSAVDASGRLVAWEFHNWNSGASAIRSPYEVANQHVEFHPCRSPLKQGSYRGLAATANHYAREMHVDEIARTLGVDAVEFRLRHLKDERMRAVLEAAAKRAGWPRASASGGALGIACGTEKGSYVATAAELSRAKEGFKVERLVVSFECGAVVNPDGLRNQIEGSVVQGLGGALFEAIQFADGQLLNGTLADYRVPRFADVPPIDVVILDRRDLPSAGAGETPIVAVAPAIGSAARAFGPVLPALPIRLAGPKQP
jgi:isoquinoline 1-oxidoreductase